MTIYEIAIDYQRLADDLGGLAADVLHADRTALGGAPPHLRELADAALRAASNLHQGLRDDAAGPLLPSRNSNTRCWGDA